MGMFGLRAHMTHLARINRQKRGYGWGMLSTTHFEWFNARYVLREYMGISHNQ